MGTSVTADHRRDVDPDWRRLRYGIAFFVMCLAVSVSLFAMGLYH